MSRLAALGLFVFSAETWPFENTTHRREYRHATSPRVGARDATQFVGPGREQMTISGTLYPLVQGSFTSIDTLNAMAAEGDAYAFVDGLGNVLGTFVIENVDARADYFMDNGVPRRRDFAIDLLRVD